MGYLHSVRHQTSVHGLLALVFLIGWMLPFQGKAQEIQDTSLSAILARAYSMLKVHSPEAEKLFLKAATIDPVNVRVRNQLGYIYYSQKQYELALDQFRIADSLQPSDTTKLQIAHTLLALNRGDEASALLNELVFSPSDDIREKADAQLDALPSLRPFSPWWSRVYGVSYYDTRWNTTFYLADLQHGYNLTRNGILSVYGFLRLSGDARSSGGLAPEIFSDNSVIVGLGLRTKPFMGFELMVQQGLAFDVIEQSSRSRVSGDFRAFAVYGNGVYAPFTLHSHVAVPFHPFADVYASFGYYSRYENSIGYLLLRGGVRVFEASYSVADVYGRINLARDASFSFSSGNKIIQPKDFYNNINEWGGGIRFAPNVNWGLYVAAEHIRGEYSHKYLVPPGRERTYDGFRFFIIFDRAF